MLVSVLLFLFYADLIKTWLWGYNWKSWHLLLKSCFFPLFYHYLNKYYLYYYIKFVLILLFYADLITNKKTQLRFS